MPMWYGIPSPLAFEAHAPCALLRRATALTQGPTKELFRFIKCNTAGPKTDIKGPPKIGTSSDSMYKRNRYTTVAFALDDMEARLRKS